MRTRGEGRKWGRPPRDLHMLGAALPPRCHVGEMVYKGMSGATGADRDLRCPQQGRQASGLARNDAIT